MRVRTLSALLPSRELFFTTLQRQAFSFEPHDFVFCSEALRRRDTLRRLCAAERGKIASLEVEMTRGRRLAKARRCSVPRRIGCPIFPALHAVHLFRKLISGEPNAQPLTRDTLQRVVPRNKSPRGCAFVYNKIALNL